MKKNLLAIILLTASLASCTTAQTPREEKDGKFFYDSLPKEYKEYRDKTITEAGTVEFEPGKFFVYYEYDINSDGRADVVELYKPTEKYPIAYGFDLNQNGEIERGEMLMDHKADGLNGNETLPELKD
jgi:hypothetical protein